MDQMREITSDVRGSVRWSLHARVSRWMRELS